ncbi:hypothetical protein [Massilicoli timonensis]|uniref:hypothetical protein n=1 Tax=Massilicoli timonensis TaxID=2015901 RepID=UPI000C842926|nr:hypothetical protein [Massilicoli timonensis]
MRSIKETARIVKNSMDHLSLSPENFVKIEILFRLCEIIGINERVNLFYTLLQQKDIIVENNYDRNNFLLSNAKILLNYLSYSKNYHDILKEYTIKSNLEYCLYKIEDNKIFRNPTPPTVYTERVKDYDKLLNTKTNTDRTPKPKADYNNNYIVSYDRKSIPLPKLEKLNKKENKITERERKRRNIEITKEELLCAADKLDVFEHKNYRRKILEDNIYYTRKGEKQAIDSYTIDGVINMAGQVGSGKSTFADALSVAMMDKEFRIVMIQPTINQVLEKAELFSSMGYNCIPLIGNSSKKDHINHQMNGKDYLPEYQSFVLQQPCLLNALLPNDSVTFQYGKEPCFSFTKANEKYENMDEKRNVNKKYYLCPYYDICPRNEQDREIKAADIVITTLEGFSMIRFSDSREIFMSYAIRNFDLVIIDEVDNALCKLDSIFSPVLKANEYFTNNTKEYREKFEQGSLKSKIEIDNNQKELYWNLYRFQILMVSIGTDLNENLTGWSDSTIKSFSGFSLLQKLKREERKKDKNTLSDIFWDSLSSFFKFADRNTSLYQLLKTVENSDVKFSDIEKNLVDAIVENSFTTNKTEKLSREQIENEIKTEIEDFSNEMRKRLLFLLKVIAFEQVYHTISISVGEINDLPMDLREILNRSFVQQQKILPSSPIGNTLSIEYKRDDDLYIKKQFAFGRALAMKMPYLVLDDDGSSLGANVLLLSGTGFIPGSNKFHVSDTVDYIIEAEQIKRDFIANSEIINLRSETRVSGIFDDKKKEDNLKKLIKEKSNTFIKCVRNEENILVIVNSYEQCKIAQEEISKILKNEQPNCHVYRLNPDSAEIEDEAQAVIQRRDITSFKEGILVAPACVIERGFNIVDPLGNATFDTVFFLVRPLNDPSDFQIHVQRVNGYIMNKFSSKGYENLINIIEDMRKEAYGKYSLLNYPSYSLSTLLDEDKKDIVASLFVTIQQIFGRLCRIGATLKNKYPKIYFVDGAFNAPDPNSFDTLKELEKYLEEIMDDDKNGIVARTLYEPFYEALKKGEK